MRDNNANLKQIITANWEAYEKAKLPLQKEASGLALSNEEIKLIQEKNRYEQSLGRIN